MRACQVCSPSASAAPAPPPRASGGGGLDGGISAGAAPATFYAVALNRVTLQFCDRALQREFARLMEPRRQALWLRSLLAAALFQVRTPSTFCCLAH